MDRGGFALRILFWIALAGCVYSYAVYPALLALFPVRRRETQPMSGPLPKVSLIIACRNEQARLRHKLDNALAVDYPAMEIIVASDASDDGSDDDSSVRRPGAARSSPKGLRSPKPAVT